MATYKHCTSTDKKPDHSFCPKGVTITIRGKEKPNWCFYNRAKAMKEKPKSHKEMSLKLNATVAEAIEPVYERLSDRKILLRCTKGATQNANESLHSVVWKYCPKKVFVGRPRLEVAVARAVGDWNMGTLNSLDLRREKLNQDTAVAGPSKIIAIRRDEKRVAQSKVQKQITQKKRKRKAESKKKAAATKKRKGESDDYEAGGFV